MNLSRMITPVLGLVALLGWSVRPAHADSTLSGTFGDLTVRYAGYSGPLNMPDLAGGSFYGTFSTDGLPALSADPALNPSSTYLTRFSINILDKNGNVVLIYSDLNSNDSAFVNDFEYSGQELNTLNFEDVTPGAHSGLQLTFSPGFTGTGTTPVPSLFNGYNGFSVSNSADLTTGWDKISIVSAVAAPLPTSATGGAILIALLAGSTRLRRRAC